MKINLLLFLSSLIITGCGSGRFPSASEYWKKGDIWPGYEIVQKDMHACGFPNTWNYVDMPKNEKLKAHLCMEKKGYLFNGEPTCKWDFYKNESACTNID